MRPERLDEILKKYRANKARYAYLCSQMDMLKRFLSQCERQMVNDQVSLSQQITGMPHGSGVGDPTGRLALDIASGRVSVFVKQIREEIEKVDAEQMTTAREIGVVEIVLQALSERERQVLTMKIIDGMSWAETLAGMNQLHNNSYSKRSLQRLLDKAMDTAIEIVR